MNNNKKVIFPTMAELKILHLNSVIILISNSVHLWIIKKKTLFILNKNLTVNSIVHNICTIIHDSITNITTKKLLNENIRNKNNYSYHENHFKLSFKKLRESKRFSSFFIIIINNTLVIFYTQNFRYLHSSKNKEF